MPKVELLIWDSDENADKPHRPQRDDVVCTMPGGWVWGSGDLSKCRAVTLNDVDFEDAKELGDAASYPEGEDDGPLAKMARRYRIEADGTFTDKQRNREKPIRGVPRRSAPG